MIVMSVHASRVKARKPSLQIRLYEGLPPHWANLRTSIIEVPGPILSQILPKHLKSSIRRENVNS